MKPTIKYFASIILLVAFTFGNNAHAQRTAGVDKNYRFSGGIYNPITNTLNKTPNRDYDITITPNGNTVQGILNIKSANQRATFTGTLKDGIIHGTLNWVSAPENQKVNKYFSLYKETRLEYPTLAVYKNNDYMTNSRTRASFSYNIIKQAGTSSGVAHINSNEKDKAKKAAKKMAGFYQIKDLMDINGTKHDVYVEIKDYPNRNDPRKSEITAFIVGNRYGLGTGGKLFSGTVDQDNISLVIDVIYEQANKKTNLAKGRIVWVSNRMLLNAPKFNYPMEKVTKAVAEREGNIVTVGERQEMKQAVPAKKGRRITPISKRN
ncbi:hypothetical protein FXV77_14305 [Sphingobacterium phlebotomi]|uniref:Uncharacterized protein n=1 Tax=Sphingobacterium phlebotomi TaxID=2605433 RepID=A0A5D4H3L8_9SPHI|nr:hypothetical protein [Sphingobacterium phlebotomi]TYR35114.1 hypothetical protein FXV77_14305 [Sphingobacterium phlebotomi]